MNRTENRENGRRRGRKKTSRLRRYKRSILMICTVLVFLSGALAVSSIRLQAKNAQYKAQEEELEAQIREEEKRAQEVEEFEDYVKTLKKEGNFRYMGSDIFFHSLEVGETCEVKLEEGKIMMVKLHEVRPVDSEGYREAIFEVDGNRRSVHIKDTDVTVNSNNSVLYADEDNPLEVGANIPGNIIRVLVKEGDEVEEKQPIAVIEAMKMETNILATAKGTVEKIYISEGQQVKAGEMVAKLK